MRWGSHLRILGRHILPQALPSVIVAATLGVAYAILIESALRYLGLGVRPPTPSWGNMLSGARSYLRATPLLALFPGLLILAYNSLGEGLRDMLSSQALLHAQAAVPRKAWCRVRAE
jgi:peptide/nickel transport system permease protein